MITPFVCLILAAAAALLAERLYKREEALAARAAIFEAEIVGYDDQYDGERQAYAYAPIFRYTDPDGVAVEARSHIYRETNERPAPGGRLRIRVDPARPREAEAATFTALHWPSLIAAAGALFCLVLAVVTLP